ncbi:hypothetical protein LTR85_002566 [Meristemomyces frigidus]|nr:hypothetical protein LTR85_002566 [Meristemomyces frigidus]
MYQRYDHRSSDYGAPYSPGFGMFGPINSNFGSTTDYSPASRSGAPELRGVSHHHRAPVSKHTRYDSSTSRLDRPADVLNLQERREAWALSNPDQLSQWGLMQQMAELQARFADSFHRFTSTKLNMDQVRDVWEGQADVNSAFQSYAQTSQYSKQKGWYNCGRISADGGSIIRLRANGAHETITSYTLLEIEDCSPWKVAYGNPTVHRLDGPEGSAFVGKHQALALGLTFGQLEVVHGYSSKGQGIKKLTAADVPHKMVACHHSEEAYLRRHLPEGFNIITTQGRWYQAYTIYDFTNTTKIDHMNRVKVCGGQPTEVGREQIRKMVASVKQAYQSKLDAATPQAPQSTDGGMRGQWPWPLDEEDMRLLSPPRTPPRPVARSQTATPTPAVSSFPRSQHKSCFDPSTHAQSNTASNPTLTQKREAALHSLAFLDELKNDPVILTLPEDFLPTLSRNTTALELLAEEHAHLARVERIRRELEASLAKQRKRELGFYQLAEPALIERGWLSPGAANGKDLGGMTNKVQPRYIAKGQRSHAPFWQDGKGFQEMEETEIAEAADAVQALEGIRTDHNRQLQDFLEDREAECIIGTRSDFDRYQLVNRHERNNESVTTQAEYQLGKRLARSLGVLPSHIQTSEFANERSNGYAESAIAKVVHRVDRDRSCGAAAQV